LPHDGQRLISPVFFVAAHEALADGFAFAVFTAEVSRRVGGRLTAAPLRWRRVERGLVSCRQCHSMQPGVMSQLSSLALCRLPAVTGLARDLATPASAATATAIAFQRTARSHALGNFAISSA